MAKIKVIRESDIPLSTWAGGTSRQYFIYPPQASYSGKDFKVRISSAEAATDEKSDYTRLPGITRHLLILEGSVRIEHANSAARLLEPLTDIDTFDGGIETSAAGKCRDLNFMLGCGVKGTMKVIQKNEVLTTRSRLCAFFCAQGDCAITINSDITHQIVDNEMLLCEADGGECVTIALKLSDNAGDDGRVVSMDADFLT
jgi:environmental stress-induced protein Ves